MSRRKRQKRDTREYLDSAAQLSKYVPSLKKLKRRKTLTRGEKWKISYYGKKLRYLPNLIPLSKKQAKELKGQLRSRNIQAIQLVNVGKIEKITVINKKMFVGANGRNFLFWRVDDLTPRGMEAEAEEAFAEEYPIEKIMRIAELAFENMETISVQLWTNHGVVGQPFLTLQEFAQWLLTDYSKYKNVHRFVNGIAVLISDVNRKESDLAWIRSERAKAKQERRKRANLKVKSKRRR